MTPEAPEAEDFLPLHPFEFRILLVLLEDDAHGYRIVKAIEERDAGWKKIFPANLYRRLRDMLSKGLVEEIDPPADAAEDDRPRRYFRITPLGREVARLEATRLQDLLLDARDKNLVERA